MRNAMPYFLIPLILGLPTLAGAREVDETRPADPTGTVEIEAISLELSVIGWDRDEVHLVGSIRDDVEDLDISSSGKRVSIELEPHKNEYRMKGRPSNLEVSVPRGSRLELETVSGKIVIEDIEGAVSLETVSSSVEISGSMRDVEVSSISGRVDVDLRDNLRNGEFETVSGEIELRGSLGPKAELSAESVSGDITLRLPSDTSARFSIETFSGDISNDFGPRAVKSNDYLPAKSLRFTAGSGDASVSIEAFSGDVRLVHE